MPRASVPKPKRTYTPADRGVALATLEHYVRPPRTFADATEDDFKLAAKFANVEVAALRLWASGGTVLDALGEGEAAASRAGVWDGAARPMPPEDMQDEGRYPERLVPAPDMWEWAKATFVVPGSPLENLVHSHLAFASVGIVWSNYPKKKQGRVVAGFCEKPPGAKGMGAGHREDYQLRSWFGGIPDFLITLDSVFWGQYGDRSACALIEHEMGHAGQVKDQWGVPKWKDKGPVFGIVSHTVEEFDFCLERYGVDACAAGTKEFLEVARRAPAMDEETVAIACGTCGR